MSVGTDAFAKAKSRVKQLDNPPGAPVDGVTAASYPDLAKGYEAGRGGTGFVIAPKQQPLRGGGIAAKTTDEWGAWLAYFVKIGKPTKFMESQGYYTVPAQWPHQFDVNQNPDTDYAEAAAYRKHLHEKIARESLHAPIPGKLKSTWAQLRAKHPIWEEPKATRVSLIDEARLLDSYNVGIAEMEAQRAIKNQRQVKHEKS